MTSEICYPDSTDWACVPPETVEAMDPAMKARAEALAWSTLAALTAYQIGTCPVTVRPCLARCKPTTAGLYAVEGGANTAALGAAPLIGTFNPHIDPNGVWVNSCGCQSNDCSCTALCEALLPAPVGSIVSVVLDGATLDPSAYRVDNGYRLVRTDGGCWPACQDMSKPGAPQYEPIVVTGVGDIMTATREGNLVTLLVESTGIVGTFASELPYAQKSSYQTNVFNSSGSPAGVFIIQNPGNLVTSGSHAPSFAPFTIIYETTDPPAPNDALGTFEVTYYRGTEPNVLTQYAAGVLAYEFYQACAGGECRLPDGVTQISRQGIQMSISTGLFSGGLTGIREVDAVIGIYNPHGLSAPPVVTSPDRRPARMTTWSR